jgi:NADH-quinone oxidoreductase subunit C
VSLAQDFRNFDFLSPWEGAAYVLPGDEKAAQPQAKGAQTPVTADALQKADAKAEGAKPGGEPAKASSEPYAKTTADSTADTGKGAPEADAVPKPKDPDVIPSKLGGQNE